ncbi:hypothetical protein L2E82_09957 [Cichorium intybus]|uniref:Uncharacterized protein n=1 Tax=Cichorium intybus TaxID=13427 RepID=A0ACB9G9K4_CICIN|nr:hypothetical protein L2E82_09957 [Cichorium intybus]
MKVVADRMKAVADRSFGSRRTDERTNGRTKIRSGVGCQPPCSSMQPFSVLAPSLWKLQGATIDGTDEVEMLRREYMAAIKEM